MGIDAKSNSFTFHGKTVFRNDQDITVRNCRRKLQDRFEQCESSREEAEQKECDESMFSTVSLGDNTRRVLRAGFERVSKTFSEFRTAVGSLTQKFKVPTRRRQILVEGPMTPACATPHALSRAVLGRTPTKLYSPFGIESPRSV